MCLVADIDHTRSIDIRAPLALFGVAIGLVSLSVLAQAACNVRGEFCGYPAWAANAFFDPFDRVGVHAALNINVISQGRDGLSQPTKFAKTEG